MAYFQLYSEALYSLMQGVLNRFYDEVFENNYSTMLTRIWRTYFEHYFKFIVAKSQGREFLGRDSPGPAEYDSGKGGSLSPEGRRAGLQYG
ncbi:MAG: hypothetical protein IH802_09990 [Nitrospinae bacterium]|nr:hypothetical protein [Nitrospinota bacterium]